MAALDSTVVDRCLDRPLAYGRMMRRTRGPWLCPYGVLQLRPEGVIDGYVNPNEARWSYAHGRLCLHHASGYPRNVFSALDEPDLMMGQCNDINEPSAQFLAPFRPLSSDTDMTFVIGTCPAYWEHTIPPLVKSLSDSGIDPANILVAINDSTGKSMVTDGGMRIMHTRHRAWEYSSLLLAAEDTNTHDHICFLHDTIGLGVNFFYAVYASCNAELPFDCATFHATGQTHMGVYRKHFLRRLIPLLESLDGISKDEAVFLEVTGRIYDEATLCQSAVGAWMGDHFVEGANFSYLQQRGTYRRVRRFSSVDIDKYTYFNHAVKSNL